MNTMNRLKLALITIIALSTCVPLQAGNRFGAETFKLANGLQVVVIRNARAPIVHHALWFKCGGIDDPEGESGTAHFLEHMMFKQTKNHEKGEYSKLLAEKGGVYNAFTSRDLTSYYAEVAKEYLPQVMELEADRMHQLIFDPQEIKSERKVIIEERKSRIENSPKALLEEGINNALYWHHPYGRPLIGWMHEMEGLQLEDVQAFYQYWYAPNNAILILAGDITVEEARTLAEKYYGPIESRTLPDRIHLREPVHNNITEKLVLKHERVEHPSCFFYIPVEYNDKYKDPFILDVISDLLFREPLGRVYKKFVEEKKLATRIDFSYESLSLGPKYLEIEAQPTQGVALEDLEKAITAELADLKDVRFTREEVKAVIDRIIIRKEYEKDVSFAGAQEIGFCLSLGLNLAQVEQAYDIYATLDERQVNKMMGDIFSIQPRVSAELLPLDKDVSHPRRHVEILPLEKKI